MGILSAQARRLPGGSAQFRQSAIGAHSLPEQDRTFGPGEGHHSVWEQWL